MSIDLSAVKKICRETDQRLWNAYHCREIESRPEKPFSRLVFPAYANGDVRVSEQEARFAFVESILDSDFFYSVETPTKKQYQFTGKSPRSAQTDFTVCDEAGTPILNTEFKKSGSSDAKNKDVQKLLHESVPGMWFHLIDAVHNATLKNLLDDLSSKFSKGLLMPGLNLRGKDKDIVFHICVLRQKFSIHKKINFSQSSNSHKEEFVFPHQVSRQRLTFSDNANGWDIHQISS